MNGLPYGATFGTLVHEVLEYVDTSAPDIETHVRELCSRALGVLPDDIDADVLVAALVGVLAVLVPLTLIVVWGRGPTGVGGRLLRLVGVVLCQVLAIGAVGLYGLLRLE